MKKVNDWHNVLIANEFELLENNTKTYGNGLFTGSIVGVNKKGNIRLLTDREISYYEFCPFFEGEKHQSVRIKNEKELKSYIKDKKIGLSVKVDIVEKNIDNKD